MFRSHAIPAILADGSGKRTGEKRKTVFPPYIPGKHFLLLRRGSPVLIFYLFQQPDCLHVPLVSRFLPAFWKFLKHTIRNGDEENPTVDYHNNAYSLIEYVPERDVFTVNYKNRNGERRKDAVTYEQLYSVMENLIRAQMFTGEVRMSSYLRDFANLPYEKMSALEKQFDDKLTSLRSRHRKSYRDTAFPQIPSLLFLLLGTAALQSFR
mgnify:CR=1 FL=1